MVCRPFCYKTCTRILRVQPRLQMGQVSIIENSFPQERSQKLKPHYIAPGLSVLYCKKNECFFKIYIVCFPLLPLFTNLMFNCKVLKLYNLVGWYLIWAFLKTTWRICPINLGQKIFCITVCLGEITILNCGSERSSSLWWRNDILSRTDFSYLFVFFLLCSFFYTLIKMIISNSNSQVQGFIWMNKNEKGTLNKTKFVKGCFSHVQTNTSLGKVAQ